VVGERVFVVVSGLAGSGKTTVAQQLARRLALPLLGKDVILESLFDSLGVGDERWRARLSRASDEALFRLADASQGAVLDNWWHRDTAPARIRLLGGRTIEVFCDCDPDTAAQRFATRVRHPGHLDAALSAEELAHRADYLRQHYRGPLRLGGALLVLDTNRRIDGPELVSRVAALLEHEL
jgi:predicted kinase